MLYIIPRVTTKKIPIENMQKEKRKETKCVITKKSVKHNGRQQERKRQTKELQD